MSGQNQDQRLWTEKYRPKTIDEFIGNQAKVAEMDKWLKDFPNKGAKKILLISGPSGIGKTSICQILLAKYGYVPIEINTASLKTGKGFREIFDKIFGFKSIVDIFSNGIRPSGVIIDEIDTLCQGGEKGNMSEFLTFIKDRKNKDDYDIPNPIICSYSHLSDKRLTELKKMACEIKLTAPSNYDMEKLVTRISAAEGFQLEVDARMMLIKHATGDVRRLVNFLYDIYSNYRSKIKAGETTITLEMIQYILDIMGRKQAVLQIFDMTNHIFNQKMDADEMIGYYYNDTLLFPMMLHENYHKNVPKERIPQCADAVLWWDQLYTEMYDNNNLWEMSDLIGLYLCKTMNISASAVNGKKNSAPPSAVYTTLLNKMSQYFTNKKFINNLENKLQLNSDMDFNDIYYLSEMIAYYLFDEKAKPADRDKGYALMKEYNISADDIDVLLRVNKFYKDENKKKYTAKMKKDLTKSIT